MSRPRKCRRISQPPIHRLYKPQGVPGQDLTGVRLPVEGLEALRLADAQGLDHVAAAEMMGISRPTFSRVLTEARRIVACGLSNGWSIHIEGGHFEVASEDSRPNRQHRGRAGGGRRGRRRE
jgi:predicted DNA-binding protein (UPF0251 family)